MAEAWPSETMEASNNTTRRHNQEKLDLNLRRWDKLKFRI
jgi:hypothetical protein